MRNILVTLFVLYLAGCSYNNVFQIDSDIKALKGVNILYDSKSNNVNMVFVHGMGVHPIETEAIKKGVTHKYQNKIAKRLGFAKKDEVEVQADPIKLKLKGTEIIGGKVKWRQFENSSGKTLNLFALSWDEITVTLQQELLELDDSFLETKGSKNREQDRVWLNRKLKKFINSSFADPALYIGSFGSEIRFLVAQGIAEIDNILTQNNYYEEANVNKMVLVADSLGSSVVFDTVQQILDVNPAPELSGFRAPVERFSALTSMIFMNANQLPLIELGRIEAPLQGESQSDWLNRYPCSGAQTSTGILGFSELRDSSLSAMPQFIEEEVNEKLQVVAFTDPNDALSYYLTKRFKQRCSKEEDIVFANVLLTNAKWNYLFSLAHPINAHSSGFKSNPKALDILVNGYNSKKNHE